MDKMANRGLKGNKVPRVNRDPKVNREKKEIRETKASVDCRGSRERKEIGGSLDLQGKMARTGKPAILISLMPIAQMDRQISPYQIATGITLVCM